MHSHYIKENRTAGLRGPNKVLATRWMERGWEAQWLCKHIRENKKENKKIESQYKEGENWVDNPMLKIIYQKKMS